MPPKHIPPAIGRKSFSCPNCGAFADQTWFEVHATTTKEGQPPLVLTPEKLAELKNDPVLKGNGMADVILRLEREVTGQPFLFRLPNSAYAEYELTNINLSRCRSCGDIAIWRHDALLYPPTRYDVEPNSDLPPDIRTDFEEARTILDLSPRGAAALLRLCLQKLCKHLGQRGENINDDIAALVNAGLDAKIQQALDIVRVVGNQAVHPGVMDLKDDRALAAKLFELVNLIAYDRITQPKEIAGLFKTLPDKAQAAIAVRDGSK